MMANEKRYIWIILHDKDAGFHNDIVSGGQTSC
jgi:hypothetical protein